MVDLLKLPPLIFDIETDGLLDTISKIHCIVVGDQRFPPEKVGEAVALLQNHDGVIVGHNIVAFDIPAIQKFYPGFSHNMSLILRCGHSWCVPMYLT